MWSTKIEKEENYIGIGNINEFEIGKSLRISTYRYDDLSNAFGSNLSIVKAGITAQHYSDCVSSTGYAWMCVYWYIHSFITNWFDDLLAQNSLRSPFNKHKFTIKKQKHSLRTSDCILREWQRKSFKSKDPSEHVMKVTVHCFVCSFRLICGFRYSLSVGEIEIIISIDISLHARNKNRMAKAKEKRISVIERKK